MKVWNCSNRSRSSLNPILFKKDSWLWLELNYIQSLHLQRQTMMGKNSIIYSLFSYNFEFFETNPKISKFTKRKRRNIGSHSHTHSPSVNIKQSSPITRTKNAAWLLTYVSFFFQLVSFSFFKLEIQIKREILRMKCLKNELSLARKIKSGPMWRRWPSVNNIAPAKIALKKIF